MSGARARFCACPAERFKAGAKVFLKEKGVLTTRRVERDPDFPAQVGGINPKGEVEFLSHYARFFVVILAVAGLGAAGCRSTMGAKASCAYKAGTKKYYSQDWYTDPEGACSFTLEAPIKRAGEAQQFADAFKTMFRALPETNGIAPAPKLETKIDPK